MKFRQKCTPTFVGADLLKSLAQPDDFKLKNLVKTCLGARAC